MDLKMEAYTPLLELTGVLEAHRSVIWETKAFGAGSFSVDAPITAKSKNLLVPGNIVWIADNYAGVIEYVQEQSGKDGPYITVKGPDLTGILGERILWGQYNLTGAVPAIMHSLVNDCCISPTRGDTEARKIPGLVSLTPAADGDSIRIQKTGGTLLEALEELGSAFGVAFGVRFNPAVPRMEFWTRWGQNRSMNQETNATVFYSTELDDVLSSEYSYNAQDWRNVALVAGEGEGSDRVMVTVEADVQPAPTPPEPQKYTITLSVDPQGGGTVTGSGSAEEGMSVTVSSTPASGYTFSGWRENGAIVSTSPSYTFTVTSDRSLTAVFAAEVQSYNIVTSVDPAGAGTASGGGTYTQGQSVTLQAVPASGYRFVAWREGGADVSTDTAYTFTVSGNRTITAVFAAITYTVTTSTDPANSGTTIITGTGTYQQGESVTVTASPDDGYKFVKWTENGQTVSESASYTFTVSGDRALVAVFEAEQTSRLPAGYTEVEWIQADTLTSYISTTLGINGSDATFNFKIPNTTGFYSTSYTGYIVAGSSGYHSIIYEKSSKLLYLSEYYSSSIKNYVLSYTELSYLLGTSFSVRLTEKSVYCNDSLVTSALRANNRRLNIQFGGASASTPTVRVLLKECFASKSDNTSSTYNWHLVPCKNSSGTAGLYDIINNKFYSATGGSFSAGPAV